MKTERLPPGGASASLKAARLEAAYYLDTYFNLNRRPAALGYRSPPPVEADLLHYLPSLAVRYRSATPNGNLAISVLLPHEP